MTDTKRNALAELAERLSPRGETKTLLLVNGRDVIKAQRIVSELAKVEYGDDEHVKSWTDAEIKLKNCRAIAEEGTEDGK